MNPLKWAIVGPGSIAAEFAAALNETGKHCMRLDRGA